ncbi:MAG: hypothetical protein QOH12_281 [Solirubrobacteraceae bacterium]|jgi:hypothetical protein|nr:hypothetical protein [Solirubrobacteraceae bacterium]
MKLKDLKGKVPSLPNVSAKIPSLPKGLPSASGKLGALPIGPQAGARVLAIARVGIGAALLIRPRQAGAAWVGRKAARQRGTQALLRSMGARDMVIGMIALHTLKNPQVGPRWQRTCAAIDGVDAIVTLAAIGDLPLYGVVWVTALAGGSALAGLRFAGGLAAASAAAPQVPVAA